mmetsp:Transcript_47071/g.105762  ORF Transcript_47071/g.105762 Transcript_47071/m.105762 type:complete len:165 (-) Transcript_47071:366-860(-)
MAGAGKATGKGRGPPLPPPPPPGSKAQKGASKGARSETAAGRAAPEATKSEPIQVTALLMDGREFALHGELDGRVDSLRRSLSAKLGISSHRFKLVAGAEVLRNEMTIRDSGVENGAVLQAIILPPLYGTLGRAGVAAPGEVVAAKMELHDALAEAGKLTPIFG